MKKYIFFLLACTINVSAAEYGRLLINNTTNIIYKSSTSQGNVTVYDVVKDLVLNEGDSLTFVSVSQISRELQIHVYLDFGDYDSSTTGYYWPSGSSTGVIHRVSLTDENSSYHPAESRTIYGPVTISAISSGINRDLQYRINRSTDPDGSEKFSVSLDNDGDRVAVGYKENGTNAVVRIYQFNGSSWGQLGEDIE